jgi:hypothetical protein
MDNIKKLRQDIKKKLDNWNERSNFTLKGVKNLSKSDLDTIELYADIIEKQGNYNGLMKPLGAVAQVLQAYNII